MQVTIMKKTPILNCLQELLFFYGVYWKNRSTAGNRWRSRTRKDGCYKNDDGTLSLSFSCLLTTAFCASFSHMQSAFKCKRSNSNGTDSQDKHTVPSTAPLFRVVAGVITGSERKKSRFRTNENALCNSPFPAPVVFQHTFCFFFGFVPVLA